MVSGRRVILLTLLIAKYLFWNSKASLILEADTAARGKVGETLLYIETAVRFVGGLNEGYENVFIFVSFELPRLSEGQLIIRKIFG